MNIFIYTQTIMGDEFNLNEPLSFKVTGNFGEREESAITAKMIRKFCFLI